MSLCSYDVCYYTECHYAVYYYVSPSFVRYYCVKCYTECRQVECHYAGVIIPSVVMLIVMAPSKDVSLALFYFQNDVILNEKHRSHCLVDRR